MTKDKGYRSIDELLRELGDENEGREQIPLTPEEGNTEDKFQLPTASFSPPIYKAKKETTYRTRTALLAGIAVPILLGLGAITCYSLKKSYEQHPKQRQEQIEQIYQGTP